MNEDSNHIVLINPFEVPEGKLEASIEYWEACRDFLKGQPGYVSTKLHQSIKANAKFELINIAVWESPKVFSEATQKMIKELGVPPVEGLKPNPSLYKIVRE
ncbi:MAG: antibiotic biosynthesis monooxygenase [Flavobacteriaceae bacterium]|nr:antibiotic biosynthesis monooxygenase [Flavobacteriaceae bacterium]